MTLEDSSLPYYSWAAHAIIAIVCLSFVFASYCSFRRRRLAMQEAKLHRLMKSKKFQRQINGQADQPPAPRRVWSDRERDFGLEVGADMGQFSLHSAVPSRTEAPKKQYAMMFSRFQHGRAVRPGMAGMDGGLGGDKDMAFAAMH